MTQPKISVFTYSCNNPGHIAVAINSVLKQTFPDFEYFVLESSNDNLTPGILSNFTDPRLHVIKNYSNIDNIPRSQGKYVMFFSDNDILMTNCFEEHLMAFETFKTARATYHTIDVIYTDNSQPGVRIFTSTIIHQGQNPPSGIGIGAAMFERDLLNNNIKTPTINDLARSTDIYPVPFQWALHIERRPIYNEK